MLALALILSWIAPVANCDGSVLTDLADFRLWTERIIKTGEIVGNDGSITDIAQRSFATSVLPPDVLSATLFDPAVGGMVAWRLGDEDFAGNQACGMEAPTP